MDELDERSRVAIDRLVDIHRSLETINTAMGPGVSRVLAAYGWWTRIVRTAQAIRLLHQSELSHESSPLVRALLHHAVALKWLVEYPDEALPALVWEHRSEGNRMLNKALERAWHLDPDVGPDPPLNKAPAGYLYLKNTEAMCARVDMPHAYVAFLVESKYTHPTAISADAYLTEVAGQVVLLDDPGIQTPLRATALLAADSTVLFAGLVGLSDIISSVGVFRDSLLSISEHGQRPSQ